MFKKLICLFLVSYQSFQQKLSIEAWVNYKNMVKRNNCDNSTIDRSDNNLEKNILVNAIIMLAGIQKKKYWNQSCSGAITCGDIITLNKNKNALAFTASFNIESNKTKLNIKLFNSEHNSLEFKGEDVKMASKFLGSNFPIELKCIVEKNNGKFYFKLSGTFDKAIVI